MATDRIEIKPGTFIEISQRMRDKMGIARAARIRTRLIDPERREILRDVARCRRTNVKYSRLILDEAVELSKKVGTRKSAKITGVRYWSIVQRKRELAAKGEYSPRAKPHSHTRYSMALKQQCAKMAMALIATGKAQRAAFVAAGEKLGCNGRSIEWQWTQNMIAP